MYPHTQNKDQVALATCSLLTGSCSGGAFPKGVFEGDFGQILSHFLSFFYNTKEKKNEHRTGWEIVSDGADGIPLRSSCK